MEAFRHLFKLYLENSIKFKTLSHLHHTVLEVLWVHLSSTRLPWGISSYIFTSLTSIEGLYPGWGILLSGDFNRINVSCLLNQFWLKQLVRKPTRGSQILNPIIKNMSQAYCKQLVVIYPPFGLSDHNAILLYPKLRGPLTCVVTLLTKKENVVEADFTPLKSKILKTANLGSGGAMLGK